MYFYKENSDTTYFETYQELGKILTKGTFDKKTNVYINFSVFDQNGKSID
jgi:hypothetical protein